jgi:hypothetical protein
MFEGNFDMWSKDISLVGRVDENGVEEIVEGWTLSKIVELEVFEAVTDDFFFLNIVITGFLYLY